MHSFFRNLWRGSYICDGCTFMWDFTGHFCYVHIHVNICFGKFLYRWDQAELLESVQCETAAQGRSNTAARYKCPCPDCFRRLNSCSKAVFLEVCGNIFKCHNDWEWGRLLASRGRGRGCWECEGSAEQEELCHVLLVFVHWALMWGKHVLLVIWT